ncbi:radical SAM protein [Accumulibacter sp.]|uniref:radical SAM protein n=1 Tax=Accumulibacter sp. TaxID=2053492 RepID=UPI0026113511|nr:radical SAM protein [Accumulibacter sp.]
MTTNADASVEAGLTASSTTISAELFAIPLERGLHLVYAPLRRVAFVANATLINALADIREGRHESTAGTDRDLLDFFRGLRLIDSAPEETPSGELAGEPKPTSVTLFLTTACNLRCTYCYAAAGDSATTAMPMHVAKRGIDFVARHAHRQQQPFFGVGYHGGGEPTVLWRTMTGSFAYAEQRAGEIGIAVHGSLATNGMLKDEQIDWIVEHLHGASVSFDGLPTVHDRHRVTRRGDGSSKRVIATLRRFDETGFDYGVRVTVTRETIAQLADSIEFICRQFSTEHIQIEPAYLLGRWQGAASAETAEFVAAFRDARSRAKHHGRKITFSAARLDTLTGHFCAVSQDNFCLTPGGKVSACYEAFSENDPRAEIFLYGEPSADKGYRFNLETLRHLRAQVAQNRSFCAGCFAKWHCAGDCYYKELTIRQNGIFAGSARCEITRELLKDEILDRIEASGGLFWHQPV